MSSLEEAIRKSPAIVHREPYTVAKVRRPPVQGDHFAVFMDESETTVITRESQLQRCEVLDVEQPFALIEFRVSVPFQAPGFLARICGCLGACGINVLVYSTFSRDYVLVRYDDLDVTVRVLREAGFTVTSSSDT